MEFEPDQSDVCAQGLSIVLSKEQIAALEAAAPFDWGFPYNMWFGRDPALTDGEGSTFVQAAGHTKFVLAPQPILPGAMRSETAPEGMEL